MHGHTMIWTSTTTTRWRSTGTGTLRRAGARSGDARASGESIVDPSAEGGIAFRFASGGAVARSAHPEVAPPHRHAALQHGIGLRQHEGAQHACCQYAQRE